MIECGACGHGNRDGAKFCEECGAALIADRPTSDSVPATLGGGRYTPIRLLGEGARKRVFLSTDERLGREVAVAVIKTDGLDEAARLRLAREARSMARLGDHPQIVTVHDIGEETDGTPYIVSQYMPGGSLADAITAAPDGRMPIDEVITLALGLAAALAHAHAHGIVHRDLKPANIWMSPDGVAHLGDFGLAVPVDASRITSEGTVIGTVAYLAPEQALGRDPDPRSDLYALGAVLYECLTGRPPFVGDDAVTIISQHLNSDPISVTWHRADVPAPLERIVMQLLAKDPDRRPHDAQQVIDTLAEPAPQRTAERTPSGPDEAATRRAVLGEAEWGRFVGRTTELDELRSAFDEAAVGRTRIVMVVGEPGIGKTRTVEELGAYASMHGAQICWGHSYEGEVGLPYLPFVEALRSYVHARPADAFSERLSSGLAEVATLVSELRDSYPELPPLPPLDSDAERLRLFEGVASFLRAATRDQPLVIVLDDLHWSDKPTLLLLQHLARSLRQERLMIVGTYRDVELDRSHPLAETIAVLRRAHLYDRVLLRGLDRAGVKGLIDVIGGQETPEEFVDIVHRETEGNPFFVSEILRHFVETGAIRREGGVWVGTPDSIVEHLPEGVREVIGRRLDALSSECNEMLTVAASMPGGFDVETVGAVLGADDDLMLDLLDVALSARVVRERRERSGVYEFAHALIRQTLYGELSTPRRIRMHRRIVAALEQRYEGSVDPYLAELAYHSLEAAPGGDVGKAIDYARRAAERATHQVAHEEAVRYFEMALQAVELASDVDPLEHAELLIDLAWACHRAGDERAPRELTDRAAEIARDRDDVGLLARTVLARVGLRAVSGAGEDDRELTEMFREAVTALRDAPSTPERAPLLASVLSRFAGFRTFRDASEAAALAAEALTVAEGTDDREAKLRALIAVTWSGAMDSDEVRAERLHEIVALAEEIDDVELTQSTRVSLMTDALLRSDRAELDAVVAAFRARADEGRSPAMLANATIYEAMLATLDARYDECETMLLGLLPMVRSIGDPTLTANIGVAIAPAYRELGRLGDLERSTRRATQEAPDIPAYAGGLAQVLHESGQTDEAASIVAELASRGFDGLPHDVSLRYLLAMIAETAAALRLPEAAQIADWLSPERGADDSKAMLGAMAYHGSVYRYRALLASALGRGEDAVTYAERAVAEHEQLRAVGWVARSKFDLAGALMVRGANGDAERAWKLVTESLEFATAHGMVRLTEEAMARRLELQGVDSRASLTASIDAVSATVTVDRPDLGRHADADGQVTICFSDIVDYTRMTDRLGDARTHEILKRHNELLRRELLVHGGIEVKSEGDGFMLAFTDPGRALSFATAFRAAVAGNDWPADAGALRVRMGIHRGEVIRDADDFYGRTVIVGARVAGHASGGEILCTDAIKEFVADRFTFGAPRELELKGLRVTYAAHPLL